MPGQPITITTLGIVGAGAMGRGIAQVAAAAGITVFLYDKDAAASEKAIHYIHEMFDKLALKGKMDVAQLEQAKSCLTPLSTLDAFAPCDLVIEAVVERLEVKQNLFKALEDVVSEDCILATNTSSLSVTEIAQGCGRPAQILGFHFFNPVPLMKVVEVIEGLRTAPANTDALMSFAARIGHTPVRTKDMPGFIVNHAGRAMNTEGLKILGESVATPAQIDEVMREYAGFKLGPFELMDLTGLDVSHPVMESIYYQFYEEPRFRPSPIAKARCAAGLYGRKSGEGFYQYLGDDQRTHSADLPTSGDLPSSIWLSRRHPAVADHVLTLLAGAGVKVDLDEHPSDQALLLVTPMGEDATEVAVAEGLDARRVVAVDAFLPLMPGKRVTLMTTPLTTEEAAIQATALFGAAGSPTTTIKDSAGLIAQRILVMIVNTACEMAQQSIATPTDIDLAVRLGLGYPKGPFELGNAIGPKTVLDVLTAIHKSSGDPRYRPSTWLKRRAMLGASLATMEVTRP
ncbi:MULTISPECIES: 3-hydroxyacyl-CoA dehydrogenase [unclassified Pseudomonas]|uniref:3-hydroxyacyl-CoA dehydrogenase n=1 Tax=unclassified Pseudomonas TaxID=196821 RepID=UPI0023604F57|nr:MULTISPECIES: 3-hydroxyacyl-CoA dehydrogenase [unclassified Pseudomonas]